MPQNQEDTSSCLIYFKTQYIGFLYTEEGLYIQKDFLKTYDFFVFNLAFKREQQIDENLNVFILGEGCGEFIGFQTVYCL